MEKDISMQAVSNKKMTEHTFAERLKSIRLSKNLTQKQLAEMAGITAATLSAYENGAKAPVISTAAEIAKRCEVSLDWLCGIEPIKKEGAIAYSDIISCLIRLSEMTPVLVTVFDTVAANGDIRREGTIEFKDPVVAHFIGEWSRVKRLLDENVINHGVYDPWVAQQLIDYDCSTGEVPDKLEENDERPY